MEPKVSIIIPVYNVEPFLARCLDSVVGQTLRGIEIICVDDGSPDRSIDILNRYAAQDDRIRVISQENRGLGGRPQPGIRRRDGRIHPFRGFRRLDRPGLLRAAVRGRPGRRRPTLPAPRC